MLVGLLLCRGTSTTALHNKLKIYSIQIISKNQLLMYVKFVKINTVDCTA